MKYLQRLCVVFVVSADPGSADGAGSAVVRRAMGDNVEYCLKNRTMITVFIKISPSYVLSKKEHMTAMTIRPPAT